MSWDFIRENMVAKVDGLSEDGFEAGGMMVDMQVECSGVFCRISRSLGRQSAARALGSCFKC